MVGALCIWLSLFFSIGTQVIRFDFLVEQFLLVDLRCHGDSASIKRRGRNTVASAALDALKLVRNF